MNDSLNDIQLGQEMLANLYKNVLVDCSEPAPRPTVKFLGSNARHILILVNEEQHSFLPEEDLEFLTRILSACQLNIGDVAIVNMKQPQPEESLVAALQPARLICFGYEPQGAINVETVVSPPIRELQGESASAKELKKKLWTALKNMFGI